MVKSKLEHLLVIRLSAMGDVAMTVPVLMALKKEYPTLHITVLTKNLYEPILSQIPDVKVFPVEVKGKHKGIIGIWKLYKELQILKIDAVADLHNVLRSNLLKQFFKLMGTPFNQLDKGRPEKKALIALKNKVFKPLKPTHERYADVFRSLGFEFTLNKEAVLAKLNVESVLGSKLGLTNKKCIGIAPFAAFKGKMYPIELMEQVVSLLSDLEGYQILLFGGGEKEKKQLEVWANSYDNCTNVVDKVSFSEELTVISNLELMISMDSGNGHLAAMYGVPVLTLWGVTHPYAGFVPFGQDISNQILADRGRYPLIPTSVYGNKVLNGYERVMETISPNEICQKVKSMLKIT
ncbi:glycosyltransferase family 9 protein [Maribacter sp. CXY002]|uniref:glycosyltransferase family 9 protein n=1 Tax=Maribacter luteocoastalis TaxID=3407671 RepID=UPI003B67BEF0